MSEKRFSLNEDYGIHDHDKGIIHDIDTFSGFLEVIFELNELNDENEQLKKENKEIKNDEKQLSIDFLGYKMKLRKVLQRRYDKAKGQILYADVFLEIAEEMGVDLE